MSILAHKKNPVGRLRWLLAGDASYLWAVLVYSLVIGLLALVVPFAVQVLVNLVAFGNLRQPLVVLSVFVLGALLASAVLTALRFWTVEHLQRRLFVRVAAEVVDRLLRVKTAAFDQVHAPELVNRFLDVVTIQKSAAALLVDGLGLAIQALIGMAVLAIYHPYLLVFDAFLVVVILFVCVVLGRGAQETAIAESHSKYETQAWLEEIARHQVTFKSGAGAQLGIARMERILHGYVARRRDHFRVLMRQIGGFLAMQAVASAALLGVGGWLVMERQLTLGQLVAAELIVTAVLSGLAKFGKHLEAFYDMMAALDKLGYLLDLPVERQSGSAWAGPARPAALRLVKVGFGFDHIPELISGLTTELRPGSRIAITGPPGCGKSSLAEILYGMRSPGSGRVELDGVDYREIAPADLRSDVALVRGTEVFRGTIAENVSMGRGEIGRDAVRESLRAVELLDEILKLPDGLDTTVDSGGVPLSSGQAARLSLARAIAGQPRLLIIDEAIDSIDEAGRRQRMADLLFDRSAPWTLMLISSRPDLIRRCDTELVLEGVTQ